ncbi:aspartyl-phosphate phosphatase Spo0E family protein [Cohnella thermotolerans]|uniref:aspartyl-phosphate phosphatase Spo0E family protein n=1 Tax=Cohnella thermotolerans TaxID=329858 RepID=UPI00146FC187|nr:aspartyl-phosphate phosphatase Spo0E family protein [Cohnella thermotolerans]
MAEQQPSSSPDTAIHSISSALLDRDRTSIGASRRLEEEIDELRKSMTEAFLREESFTADTVMEISRMLDAKIIEYMKQITVNR